MLLNQFSRKRAFSRVEAYFLCPQLNESVGGPRIHGKNLESGRPGIPDNCAGLPHRLGPIFVVGRPQASAFQSQFRRPNGGLAKFRFYSIAATVRI